MNTILQTATHKIESAGVLYIPTKEEVERQWRDNELLRTDLMLQPDRPNYQQIIDYRAELRNYPQKEGFPDCDRPAL